MGASIDAGVLLREARTRGGLTQRALAARAGVTQSVISAYEAGRRQPALSTLQRLVEATGHELHVDLVLARQSAAPMSGKLGQRVRRHRDEAVRIAAGYGATNLRIFGSVARGQDRGDSDIDVLVDVAPTTSLFTLMRLERDLARLLDADVEVIPADSLKSSVRADAERDAVAL